MKSWIIILSLFAITFTFQFAQLKTADNCRFAKDFTADDLLNNPSKLDSFFRQFIRWETKFIKEVGVHKATGLTLDGIRVDVKTGELLP